MRSISAVVEDNDESCGVVVEAEIEIVGTTQVLRSPGVGDVDDEDETYLYELVEEEWTTLREVLLAVGVPNDQLPRDLSDKKLEWRE